MRKIVIILFVFIIFTSCRVPEVMMSGYDKNPFLNRIEVHVDNPTLVFFTDAHIGRERQKSGIERYDDNFISFIDDGGYQVVISGGDMADNGEMSDDLKNFIDKLQDHSDLYLETKGNHDRHTYDYKGDNLPSIWSNTIFQSRIHLTYADLMESEYGIYSTGNYLISSPLGDISIYILDTSLRSFSSLQLKWLEEALMKDETDFKIIVSHINIVSGRVFDQTLFLTAFGDEGEVARFMDICQRGKVSLILTGHHHKGNILYGDGSGYTEFNAASYHTSDSVFESKGWWYTISIDRESGEITIDGYDAETKEKEESWKIASKL